MLTDSQIERYSRQIVLQEVGGRGQETLLASSVALFGQGEIVATAGLYLAAAGIGVLAVPPDQLAHLRNLNTDVRLRTIDHIPVADAVGQASIVLCGGSPLADSAAVNAACVAAGKSLLWGTHQGHRGYVCLFGPAREGSPCLACARDLEPVNAAGAPASLLTRPIAAVVGTLLASEAIKLLLRVGTSRAGRLVTIEGLGNTFSEIAVRQRANCDACAAHARPPGRPDHE